MNLWDLKVDESCRLESLNCSCEKTSSILQELGLTKNCSIRCLYKTLFNGPRVYEINGSVCSLCKESAQYIFIKAA